MTKRPWYKSGIWLDIYSLRWVVKRSKYVWRYDTDTKKSEKVRATHAEPLHLRWHIWQTDNELLQKLFCKRDVHRLTEWGPAFNKDGVQVSDQIHVMCDWCMKGIGYYTPGVDEEEGEFRPQR